MIFKLLKKKIFENQIDNLYKTANCQHFNTQFQALKLLINVIIKLFKK